MEIFPSQEIVSSKPDASIESLLLIRNKIEVEYQALKDDLLNELAAVDAQINSQRQLPLNDSSSLLVSNFLLALKRGYQKHLLTEAEALRDLGSKRTPSRTEDTHLSSLHRRSYDTPTRQMAINLAEAWEPSEASKQSNIPVANIHRWKKNVY